MDKLIYAGSQDAENFLDNEREAAGGEHEEETEGEERRNHLDITQTPKTPPKTPLTPTTDTSLASGASGFSFASFIMVSFTSGRHGADSWCS
jgi:hypothetical protein